MIAIAVLINIIAVYKRNLWEFAIVGAWALIAIGVSNNNSAENVRNMAYLGAVLLLFMGMYCAYKMFQKKDAKNKA